METVKNVNNRMNKLTIEKPRKTKNLKIHNPNLDFVAR